MPLSSALKSWVRMPPSFPFSLLGQTSPPRQLLVTLRVLEAVLELLELVQQTRIFHAVRLGKLLQFHDVLATLTYTAEVFAAHRVQQLQPAQGAAAIHRVVQRDAELEQLRCRQTRVQRLISLHFGRTLFQRTLALPLRNDRRAQDRKRRVDVHWLQVLPG